MDLDPTPEQRQLVDALHDFLAVHCPSDVVRASEPGGFDPRLWAALSELVPPTTGVAAELGGGGASLLDLELVSEQVGHFLAPAPFVEGAVAARVLADTGAGGEVHLERLAGEPATVATVALHPAVGGVARLVPAGAIAHLVIGLDADELVLVGDDRRRPVPMNLGSSPLADRPLGVPGRSVLASGGAARRSFDRALDEWRVLTSGALVGLGEAALGLGTEYAKQRHQFGVPIGSFQSIARDLAEAATAVDGARLIAREAAWARDEDPEEFAALAAMAFLFAGRAARRTAAVALHVHGGYGFTLEYDIQLHYRRAQSWPLALGDPRRGVTALADALFGPVEAV